MAGEPDNLVLQLLRDICATLDEHTRLHLEHKQAFAELNEKLTNVNDNAAYAAGFAVFGRRENEVTTQRVSDIEARVKRIEERLDS